MPDSVIFFLLNQPRFLSSSKPRKRPSVNHLTLHKKKWKNSSLSSVTHHLFVSALVKLNIWKFWDHKLDALRVPVLNRKREQISTQLLWIICVLIQALIQCPFVAPKQTPWPRLPLRSNPAAPSLQIPVSTAAGEDHLLARGYRVAQFLPCQGAHSVNGLQRIGGQSCLYVPLPAPPNNSTILTNVARHAQWKLNCFLHKPFYDNQLPNQDPFTGHSEDEREQGCPLGDIRFWESVAVCDSWICDGILEQWGCLPGHYVCF